jgi:LPS-assembly protein
MLLVGCGHRFQDNPRSGIFARFHFLVVHLLLRFFISLFVDTTPAPKRLPALCGAALLVCTGSWAQSSPISTLEADEVQGRPDVQTTAKGHVDFRQGPKRIEADWLRYHQPTDRANARGHVKLSSANGDWFSGPELDITVEELQGFFLNPTYFLARTKAGGTAQRWDFLGPDRAVATQATYTSCRRDGSGTPDWLLSADRVDLNFEANEGTAKGAVLRFYGVPILAAPSLSFALSDARKSGWLPFGASSDNKGGFQVAAPYYWNMAPNYDAKFTPILSYRRGAGLETEFRYLQSAFDGKIKAHTVPRDAVFGHSRSSVDLAHQGLLSDSIRYNLNAIRVSDSSYWKDFSRHLNSPTPRLLDANFSVAHERGPFSTYARAKRWQVLQDADVATQIDAPYDRFPQLGVRTQTPLGAGFQLGFEGEFNRFVNPDGYRAMPNAAGLVSSIPRPTGLRTHALSAVSWPLVRPGWFVVPKVSMNWAHYQLDQPLGSGAFAGDSHLGRTIPSFSLDHGWTFERQGQWFGREVRQTLEPRMLYVRTPYRAQAGLPIFDTVTKDFNVDSIYAGNAFSGVDRVSDANQLTTGVTTRWLHPQTGVENARFGVAQRFLFKSQRVTPDDGPPTTQSVSDVLLFGSSHMWQRWYLDSAVQHSYELRRTVRSTLSARYTPGPYRTINMAYRLKRGESEQVDVAWQWPVYGASRRSTGQQCSGAWYSSGRVNYSLRESRTTESVLALEYDSSCWVGRFLLKRTSTSRNQATTLFGIELEFVGLSRLSLLNNPLKVLRDNVPGYLPLRKDTADDVSTRTYP